MQAIYAILMDSWVFNYIILPFLVGCLSLFVFTELYVIFMTKRYYTIARICDYIISIIISPFLLVLWLFNALGDFCHYMEYVFFPENRPKSKRKTPQFKDGIAQDFQQVSQDIANAHGTLGIPIPTKSEPVEAPKAEESTQSRKCCKCCKCCKFKDCGTKI